MTKQDKVFEIEESIVNGNFKQSAAQMHQFCIDPIQFLQAIEGYTTFSDITIARFSMAYSVAKYIQ